jgi:hypothetical protein
MTVQRLVPRNVVDQYLELSPRKALHHFPRSAFANVLLDVAECIEAGPSTRDPDLDKRRKEAIAEHAAELLSPGRKRIYEKGADMRSTGWFIESLATQCLVSFIIRTRGAPWPVLWLFNVVGLLDLAYANISSLAAGVDPAQWGASYYLVVLNVPAMVVVHVLIFAYLLRGARQNGARTPSAFNETRERS